MVVKRDPNRGVFGQKHGREVVTGVMGGGSGFSGAGFRSGGIMGKKTSGQAKASQSGSDLAKNFRASGRAGSTTKKKNWMGF